VPDGERGLQTFQKQPWASLKVLNLVAVRRSKVPKSTSIGADICAGKLPPIHRTPSMARSSPVAINVPSFFARLLHTVAEESKSEITVLSPVMLRMTSWHLAYFFQPVSPIQRGIFQCLNFDCSGGILSRIFFDHFAQVRLEDAFGAQECIGSVCWRFQTELVNQLIVGCPRGRKNVGRASCLSHSLLILETDWKPVLRWQRFFAMSGG